jgi:cytidylate kinase
MNPDVPVVAIDGPSGAGKGTVSRLLAARLGWHLLDSGALYRLVALAGADAGLAADDRAGHARVARQLHCRFATRSDGSELVLLGDRDVTLGIRSEASGAGASRVAAWPEVREALLQRQRAYASPPGLVADGRDMGTVVFPDARLKIFLCASAAERAKRRYNQLKEKDSGVSLAALSREIAARDRQDEARPISPLVPARDAIMVDSTTLGVAEVVDRIWQLGRERALWR